MSEKQSDMFSYPFLHRPGLGDGRDVTRGHQHGPVGWGGHRDIQLTFNDRVLVLLVFSTEACDALFFFIMLLLLKDRLLTV